VRDVQCRKFKPRSCLIIRADINAVIHVASPFTGKVQEPKQDMLDPAIEGTLNVVRATHKAGIKRIVVRSSFVAVFDMGLGGAVLPELD